MAAHSHIGASSMHRWAACPGSVRLCKDAPSKTSKYAEEGTRAHDLAAQLLEHRLKGFKHFEGAQAYPKEMLDAVEVYVSTVLKDVEGSNFTEHLIEHKFDLSAVHPGLFGTADCVVNFPKRGILRVYDYKHGAGVSVDVENNEQLMYYGLGAMLSSGFKAKQVELVIVQPRCAHTDGVVRRWQFPAIDLLDFAADLKMYAERTEDPNAPLASGEHCRFCNAAPTCPKLHEQANEVAAMEFQAPTAEAFGVKSKGIDLAKALQMIPALDAWMKSVNEFAHSEAMNGRPPEGWKLVAKRATRKWADPVDAKRSFELALGRVQALDLMTEPELKSPAQVEKLLPKEHKKILESLTVSVSSGLTLVPVSDKRQAAKPDALTEFKGIEDHSIFE